MQTIDNIKAEEERLKSYYRQRDVVPKPLAAGKYGYWFYAARYILQQKDNKLFPLILKIFNYEYIGKVNILDIGCGDGSQLVDWIRLGAEQNKLHGIDLLQDRVWEAKDRLPKAHLTCGNAVTLTHPDQFFYIITLNVVLSSIVDKDVRHRVCREAMRVLDNRGFMVIFDFVKNREDNPDNNQTHPVDKKDLAELFPECDIEYRTFTPMYLLSHEKVFTPLVYLLEFFNVNNVHFVAVLKRRKV